MISAYTDIGKESNLIDIFNEIAFRIQLLLGLGNPINYIVGFEDEISKQLQKRGAAGMVKYNMLALVLPTIGEADGKGIDLAYNNLRVIIGCMADPAKLFADRYTDNYVGKLYPYYRNFLKSLADSGYFREKDPEHIAHRVTELNNGQAGNILPDFIDYLWIDNLKLNLIRKENYYEYTG